MLTFEGEFTVEESPEELWPYFTDPDVLQDAAPGCESLSLRSPSEFTATLSVGVGSVKPSFDVEGVVTAADPPDRLELRASGEASRNSFEATAAQQFHDNGDGTTTVEWHADAEVSGIIASLGERALGSVTSNLVEEFFETMESHVDRGTPAESKLRAATPEETEPTAETAAAELPGDPPIGDSTGGTDRWGGFTRPAVYAGVGAVLGAIGSALWYRLRGGHDSESGSTRSSGRRVAVLLLVGLAAVVAVLLGRSRDVESTPRVSSTRTVDSGAKAGGASDESRRGDSLAETDAGDATDHGESVPGTEQAGRDDRAQETADEAGDGETGGDTTKVADDPLDRLESR